MNPAENHYDVTIVGGGLVGASLACALSGKGLRIALVEAVELQARAAPGYDDRAIALAYGTRRIFDGLQLWDSLAPEATAIHRIHVSDRGRFGMVHMDRAEGSYYRDELLSKVIEICSQSNFQYISNFEWCVWLTSHLWT